MAAQDDMEALLPEPPPPNPSRREAAIEAAMRRFDGEDVPSRVAAGAPRARVPWWTQLTRPQAGALVGALLTALIGIPVAWISISQWSGTDGRESPASPEDTAAYSDFAGRNPKTELPPKLAVEPPPPAVASKPDAPSSGIAESDDARCVGSDCAAAPDRQGTAIAAAPSAPLEMAQADAAAPPPFGALSEKGVASRSNAEASPPAAAARRPSAAAERRSEMAANDAVGKDESSIVLTARRRASPAAGRGDWNACTVNDPNRSLRGCGNLVNPGAKGPAGRAAARLADGLSRAWKGDFNGAIAAFDQAIETNPRYAFAYLNRGLAYHRIGDFNRAIADLNQAVRYAPGAARGYYHRGQLLRQQGDEKRARSDEQRAIDLDPGYAAALR